MYKGKTVSLIFPAFNEEENIQRAVISFKKSGFIDELIVVDNNSTDQTARLAKEFGATVVKEKKQGYGYALRKGLKVASSDYVVLAEPDGTFKPKDLPRLLKNLKQFDAVLGTRTNPEYIHSGANMTPFLRWGNYTLAKVIQVVHQTPSLTDCGCTFRALHKKAVKKLTPHFTVGSSHFLPEMVLLLKKNNFSFIEIPVGYYQRVGTSKITGSWKRAVLVGWNMFSLTLKYYFADTL